MSEIFDEVQEEVRREQLRRIWERYSWLIVAVAVLIVAGGLILVQRRRAGAKVASAVH